MFERSGSTPVATHISETTRACSTWVRSMYYRKAGYYQGNASWLPLYGLHKSEHAACSLTNSGVTQRRAKIKMAQDSLSPPGQDDLQVLHMGSSLNQDPFLGPYYNTAPII